MLFTAGMNAMQSLTFLLDSSVYALVCAVNMNQALSTISLGADERQWVAVGVISCTVEVQCLQCQWRRSSHQHRETPGS